LLEELQDAGPDTVLDALEEAERAWLIVAERSGREMRYRFVHELVRQTLGESISMPRRQRLHARVADAIERLYGPNLDRRASVLAHHLYQAGASADLEKAIHYLMLAATLARTGAAHEEALAHMDNALSLLAEEQHPHKAELHAARAIALRSLARSAEAIEAYERAIAGFMTGPNLSELTKATLDLASVHWFSRECRCSMSGQSAKLTVEKQKRVANRDSAGTQLRVTVLRGQQLIGFSYKSRPVIRGRGISLIRRWHTLRFRGRDTRFMCTRTISRNWKGRCPAWR
jgi:predicted ATPase